MHCSNPVDDQRIMVSVWCK